MAVPFQVIDSPAWRALRPTAHSLFLFICCQYNGRNNGALKSTYTDAKKAGLFRSPSTFYKALTALWEKGLIALTREGEWGSERTYHLWALTIRPIDPNPKLGLVRREATNDWRFWKPDTPSANFRLRSPIVVRKRAYASKRALERQDHKEGE